MSELTLSISVPEQFEPADWLQTAGEIQSSFLNPLADFVHENKLGRVDVIRPDYRVLVCDYMGLAGERDPQIVVFFPVGDAKSCKTNQRNASPLVSWQQAARDMIIFYEQQIKGAKALQSMKRKLARAGSMLK
ncbi:MAG: hypothetical protein WDN47_02350 [Candidatus Doudnabacteria bacterium]